MLSGPDFLNFFADEFTRLRGGRFSLPAIPCCTFECLFFRHIPRSRGLTPLVVARVVTGNSVNGGCDYRAGSHSGPAIRNDNSALLACLRITFQAYE